MGLIDFVKDAGEKLFGHAQPQTAAQATAGQGTAAQGTAAQGTAAQGTTAGAAGNGSRAQQANDAAADAILRYVKSQKLDATGLTVTFDGATSTVSVYGVAPDQATREKIVLCCGNVAGVSSVNDMMSVDTSAPEAQYYTVVAGDTLSKIAKNYYGDANRYMKIFEANKPMLANPDRIYPGQKLRIPPA